MSTRRDQVLAYLPNLERQARALLRGHADAADIVQDTLERALRALPRLRADSNLLGWLRTLLHNRFIDWTRRADRRLLSLDDREPAAVGTDDQPEPSAPWLDLSARDVMLAIERLPERPATILRMKLVSRMSYREISRRLGISCNTVGTQLLRARRRLRALLEGMARAKATLAITPPAPRPMPMPMPMPMPVPMRVAAADAA